MGAYTFEAQPPFRLTRISSELFSHEDFFSTPKNGVTTSNVVFPVGLAIKDGVILVSYGENDAAIKVMEIDYAIRSSCEYRF
jgi:hypothetical protein